MSSSKFNVCVVLIEIFNNMSSSSDSGITEIKKRKKGQKHTTEYKSNKIKLARVKFQPYTNYKGKAVPEKNQVRTASKFS